MRNTTTVAIAAAFAMLLAGPILAHETGAAHEEAAAPSKQAATLPMIKGEVVKIDDGTAQIQLKHEAITNLGTGAMSNFKASDPAMLKAVKIGDKVNFQADKVNGQITIMKIEKSK